ncbi:MAG: hypothetical protein KGL11_06170 [Alphaproteobacteria bacterium]|nr:hypothetical protein [Alphaproteobacteria bacterium]
MVKSSFLAVAIALSILLAACRGAEQPQVTHWYGTGSYTTGVYEDPTWYQVPGDK